MRSIGSLTGGVERDRRGGGEKRKDGGGFGTVVMDGKAGWMDPMRRTTGTLLVIHTKIPWVPPPKNDRKSILGQVERESG